MKVSMISHAVTPTDANLKTSTNRMPLETYSCYFLNPKVQILTRNGMNARLLLWQKCAEYSDHILNMCCFPAVTLFKTEVVFWVKLKLRDARATETCPSL